jgi:4-hydroxy-3-polyprenylbenzoate decarboxylase
MKPRVVVGITGASGAVYGVEVLRLLGQCEVETHLVVTRAGALLLETETGASLERVAQSATHFWDNEDLAAPIASGSFRTAGMIVAPCTIRTLSAVACCRSSNLLERAADVTLKERRPLVLMVRETPLHPGQLRLMLEAANAGATIMPPVPAFYAGLRSLEDMVEQTAARALDQLGLEPGVLRRWPPGE